MTQFILSLSHWRMLGVTTFVIWKTLRKKWSRGWGGYSWSAYAIWRHTHTHTHTHTHRVTMFLWCMWICIHLVLWLYLQVYTILWTWCITYNHGWSSHFFLWPPLLKVSLCLSVDGLVCWLWVLELPITWPFQPITTSQLIFCMRSMTKVASTFSLQTKA